MDNPDSILLALDGLISGETPEPIPESGLDPACHAVALRINQLIARLRQEEVNAHTLLDGETLPTLVPRIPGHRLLGQRLEEALDMNRTMLKASPLGVAAYRADSGQCILANPAICAIIGATKDQVLAQRFRSIPSWKTHGLLEAAERCLAGQETTDVTTPMVTSFGRKIWILATFSTFTTNREPHLLFILKDVTDQIHAEQELQKSHALLDEVGEMARIGGWELDLERNALTWSRMVREIHEVGSDYEPELATAISFYAPEAIPIITEAVRSAIEEGSPFEHQLPLVTAKGKHIWVRAIGKAHAEHGKVVRIGGVFQDITVQRAHEEKIRHLAHVVDQSPISIVITDLAGTIEFANPKACQVTGYAPGELLGQNPRIFKSGEHTPEFYQVLWQTLLSGMEWRGEFHNRRKNGELFWERSVISPLRDEEGRLTHFVSVKVDVTEMIRAEEVRQELVASLQEALEDVKTLRGLLPICAGCKKIRDEAGYWNQLEHYFTQHSDVSFTHGLCPDCATDYFPEQRKE